MKFKTRARALDMLGRQQVRGVPTALSELMKNAHDAYATEVRVDFLRYKDLLVIRDDGIGMSASDFAERWLTLGTESKLRSAPAPRGFVERPQLGEKGIGRLAMATIGPQVLVLTRSAEASGVFSALINWRIFEEPDLDLDQVEIATREIRDWDRVGSDLQTLRAEAVAGISTLRLDAARRQRLSAEVAAFPVESVELSLRLPGPPIGPTVTGTQFFIWSVDDVLNENLRESDDEASELIQDLAGFANPLDPPRSALTATFWDWVDPGQTTELIGPEAFWSEEDLKDADHEVVGDFDERGIFRGRVRVYDRWIESTVKPQGLPTSKTLCGPFSIRLGYVQGRQTESRLDPPRFAQLTARLDRIAGLYVYRDGIRILPYGRHDFDWLDIERNRSKSASYYFWSYRRMFGYVAITRAANAALSEKAGREGFRENPPYRQFRSLLRHLFIQLAADFFRAGGGASGYFLARKDELKREELARREHEKRTAEARRDFVRQLGAKQRELAGFHAGAVATDVLAQARSALGRPALQPDDASAIIREGTARLESARHRFDLELVQGVGLSDEIIRDWEAYSGDRETVRSILAAAQRELTDLDPTISAGAPDGGDPIFDDVRADAERRTDEAAAQAKEAAAGALERIEDARSRLLRDLVRLSEIRPRGAADRNDRVAALRALAERNQRLLGGLAIAAGHVKLTETDGQILAPTDLFAAADQELLRLREQVEQDLELAQLGLAVEVVGHEFRATIRAIRRELRALGAWARKNRALVNVHTGLVTSFDHLDSYLTLFTPLQRRVRVSSTTLSGGEIATFLASLFADRLKKEKARLSASDAFRRYQFEGSPATFYPVFVNLVDNALFWIGERERDRVVHLDRQGDALIVEDTGPGIASADLPFLFEAGFTRKPGGRGLGLYISREVLRRHDLDLVAGRSGMGGARFEIRPRSVP